MLTRLFTYQSLLALLLIAATAIWGYVSIQRQLERQQRGSQLADVADQQRTMGQRLVQDAVLLAGNPTTDKDLVQKRLLKTISDWDNQRSQFQKTSSAAPAESTADNGTFPFNRLDPHVRLMQEQARRLAEGSLSAADTRNALTTILLQNAAFHTQLEAITQGYRVSAQEQQTTLSRTVIMQLISLVVVLALIVFFHFIPTRRKLTNTLNQLTATQEKTQAMNHDLQQSNQVLQDTQGKLLRESALRHQQQMSEQVVRMAALMQGQEEERRRLSHALHDGLGQMLTGLKLLVENVRSVHLLPEREQRAYANLKELVIKTIQETRQISNSLMPPVLSDFGLEPALRQLVDQKAQQTGLTITMQSERAISRLDTATEIGLYRIAQEALGNAIVHANASEIDISLQVNGNVLMMIIRDNGRGVASASPEAILNGHGLHNMRERARLLNGVFRLASEAVNQGTRVIITIPLGTDTTPEAEAVHRAAVA